MTAVRDIKQLKSDKINSAVIIIYEGYVGHS